MLYRFFHNKTAVGTVGLVLIVACMGILRRGSLLMIRMQQIFSTNLRISAENILLARIIWGVVFFRV